MTHKINYMKQMVTEHRWSLFNQVIQDRTNYITVVLEDIFQAQNASAVLRTCDCFGIQDVHIIENKNEYKLNRDVVLGSSNWLSLYKYNQLENNTLSTINKLRKQSYRIVATTPHTNDVELADFDLNKGKVALFFGSELPGLSEIVMDNADEYLKIPMYGFTESFNISVSASIILHYLTHKLRNSEINWKLSNTKQDEVIQNWLAYTIKNYEIVEKDYYRRLRNKEI